MYFIKIRRTITNTKLNESVSCGTFFCTRGPITPALRKIKEMQNDEIKMRKNPDTHVKYELKDISEIKDSILSELLIDFGVIEV